MIQKFLRLSSRRRVSSGKRQLHTIISQELIKPSSPTPSHLCTYNLSPVDQLAAKSYMPIVLFYPNNDNCTLTSQEKARVLKESLSQSLTRYYPFAGRMSSPISPYVDCNDEGIIFIEARINSNLEKYLQLSELDNTLDSLFANDLVNYKSPCNTSLVGVQFNHFACGGLGLAVSMSHIIGDGATFGSFLGHWASVARYGSANHQEVIPYIPHFIQFPLTGSIQAAYRAREIDQTNVVLRKFVFPNSKLGDLKKLVEINNNEPSRVEALTSLLYKTAANAAAKRSGSFKTSYLFIMVNMRNKFVKKLPQSTFGNIASVILVPTDRHTSETSLSKVVEDIKKTMSEELEGIQSVQNIGEYIQTSRSRMRKQPNIKKVVNGSYWCSSLCGFAYSKLDFGLGKPIGVNLALGSTHKNGFMLVDTLNGDGIEALVFLEKENMEKFENDKHMLSFCQK
ncbi:epi-neemfruitin B synthase L1AT-like [Rutidosis leptorrhynchoides]|uniref:epi-neemfruitin B synthase L1AT-like n=1 Tax=Rutidosis leptorrhynchoides TaxID=125765 RepID=UPI003A9974BB